jgi:hypothetical protein
MESLLLQQVNGDADQENEDDKFYKTAYGGFQDVKISSL